MSKIFVSYSHRDERFRKELSEHLNIIERRFGIEVWTDRRIATGDNWLEKINAALAAADICILLVSHNALTSSFILNNEIATAISQHKLVFPILIHDCDWQAVDWLAPIQLRPNRALSTMNPARRNTEYRKISEELRQILVGRQAA